MLDAQPVAVEVGVWGVDDLAAADEAWSWAGARGLQGHRLGFTGPDDECQLHAELENSKEPCVLDGFVPKIAQSMPNARRDGPITHDHLYFGLVNLRRFASACFSALSERFGALTPLE
ncbi:hypothetical protein SVAN01_10908 [Stagonosporopsis vannaccii]|nr:hypothetical protein SVAN01_10908 [Stagonosporopsis vannaccii]